MNEISRTILSDLPFYINSDKISFISLDNILSFNEYNELDKLLKINSENPVFTIADEPIIIYEPYFDGEDFYCFPLKENLQDNSEAQQTLFQIMYDKWLLNKPKNIGITTTHWFNGDTTLVKYSTENLQFAIGFPPKKSVFPNTYALPEEKLPDWVQAWMADDNTKWKFLNALGVHSQTSKLVQLRVYLESKTEAKPNLGTVTDNPDLLINTLFWLNENSIQFKESDTEVLQVIKRIYDSIETKYNLPLLTVKCVNNNLIIFEFKKNSNKRYYINEQEIKQLLQNKIELKNILKIIHSKDAVLIDKRWYPDNFNLELSESIILRTILDTELLNKHSQTFQEEYYKAWRIETKNKFQIKLYDGKIPYKILFENHSVQSIIQGNVSLDNSKNIIYVNSQLIDSIDELLEQLINKSNFTSDDLSTFKKAKNSNTTEIKTKLANEQDKINPVEDYSVDYPSRIINCTKDDFKENRSLEEFKDFSSKLLISLNKNYSRWNDYIYHFTHVENAASILQSSSILPRGKRKFKDSAGQSLIGITKDYIKQNFARFYFRPLTPTQWHNELLGSRAGKIHALCPVPIFFRFRLEDVLETHGVRCAVSNGNLAIDSTHYGNSVEFLDYLDFDNIYNMFGDTNYKIASQQEFIVKNGLRFANNIDFEIICRNAQDKETLINLIGHNSNYIDKIKIFDSYYNNKNPYVKIQKNNYSINISLQHYNKSITGRIRFLSWEGHLYLKSINSTTEDIIKVNVNKQLLAEAKNNISLDIERITSFDVYFVEDEIEWLIYQYEA